MFGLFRKTEKPVMVVQIKHPTRAPIEEPKPNDATFPGHLLPKVKLEFKHVYETLPNYWGTPYFHDYMKKLLINDGRDHRAGFPFYAMLELHRLSGWHDVAFPKLKPKGDIWEQAELKRDR